MLWLAEESQSSSQATMDTDGQFLYPRFMYDEETIPAISVWGRDYLSIYTITHNAINYEGGGRSVWNVIYLLYGYMPVKNVA